MNPSAEMSCTGPLFERRPDGVAILVLPVRIELTTSPLPRGCSTTELRQHLRGTDAGGARPPKLARSLPQGRLGRNLVGMSGHSKQRKKAAAQQRLATALRDNLKRRKAQTRGR